ncbi:chemotaxis protein CheB [Azospirillum rugosum]|uniref:protein-glutamate methylesterase n=1 Tax=Azospirillum rugosum TaxID=416170 RepID=A0ABS4SWV6_9PROT|nr:chemotaxis protein CheB [Azospirillum rugosum]MBP2297030.1 two-component system chemotaxis response regulator CheB [Azospirillum rugosum]MDQ0530662.1 two-component system chemotaxis response regulator CheB [Azospirillum rugosum]
MGASAGGIEALEELVAHLPADLPAAVCVVIHIGSRPSLAPRILAKAGPLPAAHAVDGEAPRPGRIYVAPPDHHLLVEPDRLRLSRGPRENSTRPAIDPLFRSAAQAYGPRVIGVILSGALNDGTAGFSAIKRLGGTTLVQDPADAMFPGMPQSALSNTAVDHCAPASALGPLLGRLVRAADGSQNPTGDTDNDEEAAMEGQYDLKPPAALTCPECGGALRETSVDSMPVYTCHIGHRYGPENMDEAQVREIERAFEIALRMLNERAALSQRLAETARQKGRALSAQRWETASREVLDQAQLLMTFLSHGWRAPSSDGNGEDGKGSGA